MLQTSCDGCDKIETQNNEVFNNQKGYKLEDQQIIVKINEATKN